jgi:hypothetical protein
MNPYVRVVNSEIFSTAKKLVLSGNLGSSVIIPHVCNNVRGFGSGFALAVRNAFPEVAANFDLLTKPPLGYVQYVETVKSPLHNHRLIFANMVAQNGIINPKTNPRPLNYEALVNCMVNVRNYIKNSGFDKVELHCNKFGSQLAGGDWAFISDLIDDIWKNIPVVIYNYSPAKNRTQRV